VSIVKEKFETKKLPMMPIRDVVIFPHMMTPFVVGRESSVRALEEALASDKKIFLATQHDASVDEPKSNEIYQIGTVVNIVQSLKLPDGNIKVLVEGIERGKVLQIIDTEGFMQATVRLARYAVETNAALESAMQRVTGLFEKSRLPDSLARLLHQPVPLERRVFREIDSRPGWYVDLSWEPLDSTGFEIMRYDNNADPSRQTGNQFAWHTTFWDVGFRRQIGAVTLLSQAMSGSTIIRPSATVITQTDFKSAYLLIGWDLDDWWLAARGDTFQTRTRTAARSPSPFSEDGYSIDLTVSWLPRSWLRFSAEYLLVEDRRLQRLIDNTAPQQSEAQFQLVARTYL
jgi:hypothetical protein